MDGKKTCSQRKSKWATLLLGICLLLGFAVQGFAQSGAQGAINGTVKDPSGAAVVGAQVNIISQQTGVTERTVTTRENGQFTATPLPVGMYRLEITSGGFKKASAPDVNVSVTETTSVAVTMEIGEVSETVTIIDAATAVQLNSPTTGQTLGSQTVSTLPLSTRNFLTLLTLSTGANTELFQSDALGRGAVSINVNGQRPTNNNYQLEGINANDINLPTLDNVPLPNPQTVQEFKTQTSLYDASSGRNGGGNIQVALKSGSNDFHGDLFEFFRNNVLNANDFFRNRNGQPRPVNRQNQYGGSIGGPIYLPNFGEGGDSIHSGKNRHFFFFNFQGTRAASGTSAGTNFATNIPILPTNRSEANLISTFFPNGLPPGFTRLDPVALSFLNLPGNRCPGFGDQFCIPSLPGTPGLTSTGSLRLASLNRAGLGTYRDDQFVISIDSQVTTNNKVTGRYFNSVNETLQPFAGGSALPFARNTPGTNRFLKLGLTSVLSSKLVNDFRAGFNRYTFALSPAEPVSLADIGASRGNAGQFPAAFRIAVTGAFALGTGVNDDRGGAFNTFVLGDDVSYSLGSHQLRFGGEGSHYQLNRFNNFASRGSVAFGNTAAGAGGAGIPALVGLQNFLLGRITSTQGRAGFSTFYFRATDVAFYAQDDWKFNQRLTLNLGIRFEGLSVANEKFNFLSNFQGLGDGASPPVRIINPEETPVVGTPGVSRCTLLQCFTWNYAPRVGFAFDVFGDQKTVLRGGYGVYFQRTSNQPLLQTSGGPPFSEDFSAAPFSVTTANPFPGQRPQSDFPLATVPTIPRLSGFNSTTGAPIFNSANGAPFGGFRFFPRRDFVPPYSQQFNVTVQRELPNKFVAEIGYVGTRGNRLLGTGRPLNPGRICTVASPCVIPASLASGVTAPAGQLAPGTVRNADGSITITQSTADNINARSPTQFLGLATSRLFAQEQVGSSIYHSLQTSLNRRFSDNLYLQVAYTFARSIDNSSGSTFTDELNGLLQSGDLFDERGNRGLSDFDRKHRLVISYNYEIPFGRLLGVEDRGIGKFVYGWSINGVSTFQSGTPFLILDGSAFTLQDTQFINGVNRATLAGNGQSILTSGNTRDRLDNYVNLNAFVLGGRCVNNQNQIVSFDSPSCTGFTANGGIGRNVFRGPFQTNHDMSLVKKTFITETVNVEFRAEAFNVFNHPAFQSPQAQGGSLGNYGIVDISTGDTSILATANRPRTIQFALKLNF
ncbi:MAG: TonB-dependent receptor domain-containing protein [Pyrinomonadaceae bacterium]